jgi:hypothetical protein
MQEEFSFVDKAVSVAKYEPQGVEQVGKKLWFTYINNAGSAIPAYYDFASRSFKSVVHGSQYGKKQVAVRNLIARPVIEGVIG